MIRELDIRRFVATAAVELALEEMENLDQVQDRFDDVAWQIGQEAKEFWEEQAAYYLDSTTERYQKALMIYEDFGEGGVVVGMSSNDQLPIDLEVGKSSWNMKDDLLGGEVRKVIPINPPGRMPGRFRTVVATQPDTMWQHPGFRGLNLVDDVDTHIDTVLVPKYLSDIMDSL